MTFAYRTFLSAVVLLAPACATHAEEAPERGRDPWVFRCVLDGRPRVVVVAFGPDKWAAWDTTGCGLYKVWRGDMRFTGSVYDTRHGPQPQSAGTTLATFGDDEPWKLVDGDTKTAARVRFAGYRVDGRDRVSFRYSFDLPGGATATVVETPEWSGDALVRRFEVSGLPDGLALECHLDSGDGGGSVPAEHVAVNATTLDESTGAGEVSLLRLDRNGVAEVRTRWTPQGE